MYFSGNFQSNAFTKEKDLKIRSKRLQVEVDWSFKNKVTINSFKYNRKNTGTIRLEIKEMAKVPRGLMQAATFRVMLMLIKSLIFEQFIDS